MSSEPLICCITPTWDRLEFLRRANDCFEGQSYPRARCVIWKTGDPLIGIPKARTAHVHAPRTDDSVGVLRNHAISWSIASLRDGKPDFIAHFDDDDWSAPDRLSVQLAQIMRTGKLVTGFYDMTFYDTVNDRVMFYRHEDKRYALGTSLFYRREAWEQHKFPDETPEDNKWRVAVGLDNCESSSSLRADGTPIMIQTIHSANASARIIVTPRWSVPPKELEDEVRRIVATA